MFYNIWREGIEINWAEEKLWIVTELGLGFEEFLTEGTSVIFLWFIKWNDPCLWLGLGLGFEFKFKLLIYPFKLFITLLFIPFSNKGAIFLTIHGWNSI